MPLASRSSRLPQSAPAPKPGPQRLVPSGAEAPAPRHALEAFYDALDSRLGPQNWWPARTRFEVIVGALLTQSTAWKNVELAIHALAGERLLEPRAIARAPLRQLERLVRASGYYRQKARKLKAFVAFLEREFGGSLDRMFRLPTPVLREKLLAVHGIGPETADSILLYAGGHPVFVVDAYARRILARHGLASTSAGYQELQTLFETNLPRHTGMFNQYHALLVETGKRWCRRNEARCGECPLGRFLEVRS
jgi:endonuclease III related protein